MLEPGLGVDALEPLAGELGRDLGPHLLAGGELDRACRAPRAAPSGRPASAGGCPSAPRLVVAGDVLEGVEVEVGAELAVEHREHVLVELGGDAAGVVVGGLEPRSVLDQVGAEQEAGPRGPSALAIRARNSRRWLRVEVADRAAEEGDQAAAVAVGDALEVVLEVADEAAHREARVLVDQQLGGLVGDLLGDVDRDVGLAGSRPRASRRAGGGSWRPSRSRARPACAGRPPRRRSRRIARRGSRARPGSGSTRPAR